MSSYKPVQSILSQGGDGLQPLLDRSRQLSMLTRYVQSQLDTELASHLSIANLRDQTAIICADSPAWLARIRYLAPQLLRLLQARPGLENLQKIQFKILPPDSPTNAVPGRTPHLSKHSAEVIHSAADGIADPELSAALARLSRRVKPDPGKVS